LVVVLLLVMVVVSFVSQNAKKAFRGVTPSHERGRNSVERLCSLFGRSGIVAGWAVCDLVGRDLAIEGLRRHERDKQPPCQSGN
jgi:hypothetical protein